MILERAQRGFTLLELLIVIVILAVLAGGAIALLNPTAQIGRANDAKRKADLEQIQRALETYYNDNGQYPTSTAQFTIPNGTWNTTWTVSGTTYMGKVPQDPVSTQKYVYYSTGQSYWLYAALSQSTTTVCNGGPVCQSITTNAGQPNAPVATSCGATCNYGVSSSNTSP